MVYDIDELSEKFKAFQVEVNEKLSKLQNQLDQSVEDMKIEMVVGMAHFHMRVENHYL